MKLIHFLTLSIFLFSIITSFAYGQKVMAPNYQEVLKIIAQATQEYDSDEILVVFDVDDTLLHHSDILGGADWVDYQKSLFINNSSESVASSFADLFYKWGLLINNAQMHLTDPVLPKAIQELEDTGIKVIGLTARGPLQANATILSLREQGIKLGNLVKHPHQGVIKIPFSPEDVDKYITEEIDREKILKNLRSTVFADGVFLGKGQNKGVMLRALLDKLKISPAKIIFIDDSAKNVNNMHIAFKGTGIDVSSVHYTQYDKVIHDFNDPKVQKIATEEWVKFNKIRKQRSCAQILTEFL